MIFDTELGHRDHRISSAHNVSDRQPVKFDRIELKHS